MGQKVEVRCPRCKALLRFDAGPQVPERVRLRCGVCGGVFHARRPSPAAPSARDAAAAEPPPPRDVERRHRPRHRSSWAERFVNQRWTALLGLVLAAVAALLLWRAYLRPEGDSRPRPLVVEGRPALAVLDWRCGSGAADWLGTVLTEMLHLELAAAGQLRTVPADTVAQLLRQDRSAGRTADFSDLEALGARLGANLLAIGECTLVGGEQVRFGLEVRQVPDGQTVTVGETAPLTSLPEAVRRSAAALGKALAKPEQALPPALETAGASLLPLSRPALRDYGAGLVLLLRFDPAAARAPLERAALAAPENVQVRQTLAQALAAAGHHRLAAEAAASAFAGAENFPDDDRRRVEALHLGLAGRWTEAAAVLRPLRERVDDDVEPGLQEVRALLAAERPEAVRETLAALRRLARPAGRDPRIELAAAEAARLERDFEEMAAAAQLALAEARERQADPWIASARLLLAEALLRQGDVEVAEEAAVDARALFRRLGDVASTVRADNVLAAVRLARSDVAGAEVSYQQALELLEEVDLPAVRAATLANRGRMVQALGNAEEARTLFEQARSIHEELGDPTGEARLWRDLAALERDAGDLSAAERAFRSALELHEQREDHAGEAATLLDLASLFSARERLARAGATYRQALEVLEEENRPHLEAMAHSGLAETLLLEGDLAAARTEQQAALSLNEAAGEALAVAQSRLALAVLDLEAGDAAAAAAVLRELPAQFQGLGDPAGEVAARVALSRAELALGRILEARHGVDSAARLASGRTSAAVRLSVALMDARVAAAEGNLLRASHLLENLLAQAAEARQVGARLEIGLSLGEMELAAGKTAQGQARLLALRDEAASHGFGLVVQRIDRLLEGPSRDRP